MCRYSKARYSERLAVWHSSIIIVAQLVPPVHVVQAFRLGVAGSRYLNILHAYYIHTVLPPYRY